jgi:chromate transporter
VLQIHPISELIRLFLKIGAFSFGGPAAYIAIMEEEVVFRRKWLTREHFLDLVGATNLIPGPNATEIAIHIGYVRGGIPGLIAAGVSFILPAATITGLLAWAYVEFGTLPNAANFLFGIKPAVISIICIAVLRLGKTAAKNILLICIGTAVALGTLLGVNEVIALLCGGIMGIALHAIKNSSRANIHSWSLPLSVQPVISLSDSSPGSVVIAATAAATTVSLWKLGLFFLKIGSVLYGSGYVLVAFLEGGLVRDYGWLSHQQLLDAIAVGQITPGPVLSAATFVGYVISGPMGALVATVAIFLPSFFFVLLLNPVIPRLRASATMSAFLDSVNISAVGLMAAVVISLTQQVIGDWRGIVIAGVTAMAGIKFKINNAWIIAGGAGFGWLLQHV